MLVRQLQVATGQRLVTDVTRQVNSVLAECGDGLCVVLAPHATAGLALMEVGSGSEQDLASVLERLFPRSERWRHEHGSPGHGRDHVIGVFVSPSITVPVHSGRLLLGRWQSLVLVDPNRDKDERTLVVSVLSDLHQPPPH